MRLTSQRAYEATREKLRELKEQCELAKVDPDIDDHVRELTIHSLKRLINQLTEEIIRFEARVRPAGPTTLPVGDMPNATEQQPPMPSS